MNELHEIIKRLMFVLGYKTKKELAKALKISPSDLNNRINSGTFQNRHHRILHTRSCGKPTGSGKRNNDSI